MDTNPGSYRTQSGKELTGVTATRTLAGFLATAARLVPVPFLDDWLRERAAELMVVRTLRARGRSYPSRTVAPLYADNEGCMTGCLRFAVLLPIKLVLFPLRKVVGWVLAAHHLSKDMILMLLLGRTLDRCLTRGMLEGSEEDITADARAIRAAYDEAARHFDLHLAREAIGRAAGSVRGLGDAVVRTLRASMPRFRAQTEPEVAVPEEQRAVLEKGVAAVEEVLARPETKAALEAFDERFDMLLGQMRAPKATAKRTHR